MHYWNYQAVTHRDCHVTVHYRSSNQMQMPSTSKPDTSTSQSALEEERKIKYEMTTSMKDKLACWYRNVRKVTNLKTVSKWF